MKYTQEKLNEFREYIGHASDYAKDAGDEELYEKLDEVLDLLVFLLENSFPQTEGESNA